MIALPQKLVQRWTFRAQLEQSLAEELDLCQVHGFSGLLAKSLDGPVWMGGNYDANPDALRSVDQAAQQAEAAHARGLAYLVWTNPLQENWEYQADATADLALATDGVLLDLEPYAGFLGIAPPGFGTAFMERVRSRCGPDVLIGFQGDPRPQRLEEIAWREWVAYCQWWAAQHYWSDFYPGQNGLAVTELLRGQAQAAALGLAYLPTLPGNAPYASFPVDLLASLGGFAVWRAGSTPDETLSLLGGLHLDGAEPAPEEPDMDCGTLQQERDNLVNGFGYLADIVATDKVQAVADELGRLTAQGVRPTKKALRAALVSLAGIPAEAQGLREQFLMGPRPAAQAGARTAAVPRAFFQGAGGPNMLEGSR